MNNIHDGSGRVIATIFDGGLISNVNDGRGRNIGLGTPDGTFDANGKLVSREPGQFGLLVSRGRND